LIRFDTKIAAARTNSTANNGASVRPSGRRGIAARGPGRDVDLGQFPGLLIKQLSSLDGFSLACE
jgi:hypothetical protein